MSDRKETPNLLADLLGGAPAAESAPAPAAKSRAPRKRPAAPKAVAATLAPVSPPPAPPAQWEYREVVFREFRGWRPRYVDGRERWDWKEAPVVLEYLRALGEEGWELVSMGEEHNFQKTAYFKRPKTATP